MIRFTKSQFLTGYYDRENDIGCTIAIINLPVNKLYFDDVLITEPMTISVCDVDKLSYEAVNNSNVDYEDSFNYYVIDSNLRNPKRSNMGTMTINIGARPNLPPSQVGDNEISMAYNTTQVLTTSMFTTGATPPYLDPEGDAPFKLKILSLPVYGTLKLNGVNVVINQEIPFSDISANRLTYVPDVNQTSGYTIEFRSAISDTGSQQYTE